MYRSFVAILIFALASIAGGQWASAQAFSKTNPFKNTMGMQFIPLPGSAVAFGTHEVTRAQFQEYGRSERIASFKNQYSATSWRSLKTSDGLTQGDDHPVVNVTWQEAVDFCKWLSEREGLTYRLPTDLEWSLAAQLGFESEKMTPIDRAKRLGAEYYWGAQWPPLGGVGNFADALNLNDGHAGTAPVGSYSANALGYHDVGGNVREWVSDWYSGDKQHRTVRGVSYRSAAADRNHFLKSYRSKVVASERSDSIGFRVVIDPERTTDYGDGGGSKPTPSTTSSTTQTWTNNNTATAAPNLAWKKVAITYWGKEGVNLREDAQIRSGNTEASIMRQSSEPVYMVEGPKQVGSMTWVKVQTSGWMPAKIGSATFMKNIGGNQWKAVWSKPGDAFVAVRAGRSSSDKLLAKLYYGTVVTSTETKWVGSKQYIKGNFSGWVVKKNKVASYVSDPW